MISMMSGIVLIRLTSEEYFDDINLFTSSNILSLNTSDPIIGIVFLILEKTLISSISFRST